jgi:hypothetical protein
MYTISEVVPCRKVEVTEYECAKCKYRWINRINGKEGPKSKRCPKCKKWDWDEGHLSRFEKRLRRDLLKIEVNEIRFPAMEGTELYSIPTDICATFLSLFPRPTVEELTIVLNPICYLGPYDYNHHSHYGTCSDQIHCCPGWRLVPDKPGYYSYDEKIFEEMVRIEKDVRHQLMQHIIDSREGIVNTNSTHYRYFENKKRLVENRSRIDRREILVASLSSDSVQGAVEQLLRKDGKGSQDHKT